MRHRSNPDARSGKRPTAHSCHFRLEQRRRGATHQEPHRVQSALQGAPLRIPVSICFGCRHEEPCPLAGADSRAEVNRKRAARKAHGPCRGYAAPEGLLFSPPTTSGNLVGAPETLVMLVIRTGQVSLPLSMINPERPARQSICRRYPSAAAHIKCTTHRDDRHGRSSQRYRPADGRCKCRSRALKRACHMGRRT